MGVTASKVADAAVDECDVCATFDEAPRPLAAGTSLASASNERVQADLLSHFLVTPHSMDLFPRCPMAAPAPSKKPSEAWGASAALRITVPGTLRYLQTYGGGERTNKLWTICVQGVTFAFSFKGARPSMMGRRSGLARSIANRLREDGRRVGRATLIGRQNCLDAMP